MIDFQEISKWLTDFSSNIKMDLFWTLVSGIFLFLLKQFCDYRNEVSVRTRKISACKLLILQETKLNLDSLTCMLSILNEIEALEREGGESKFTLSIREMGNEYLIGELDDVLKISRPIPQSFDNVYHKVLLDVAELNKSFFFSVQNGYEGLSKLKHIHSGLIKCLQAEQNNEPFPHNIARSGFVEYAKNELGRAEVHLIKLRDYCEA
ncbi:hypothetical protein R1T44_09730 [Cobetia amphilecti]|uniref:hypothetical protein n=1 Tax=Cobetia TaxID=204286 RepID=UPI001C0550A1|nr:MULTISPECIES: hypothetical protein [Cobetia]QWN38400.1 hypothetical protein H2O77_08320 [Cobetia sp. 4B]WOI24445.1 hypothetical protein R1T44_09730 [Cobetia amphilecti]